MWVRFKPLSEIPVFINSIPSIVLGVFKVYAKKRGSIRDSSARSDTPCRKSLSVDRANKATYSNPDAGSKEFCCERGREGAERLGVETDFRVREGRAARCGVAFLWTVTRENNCYIFMVTGSVSMKLRADSAGRTISFSPV